MNNVHANRRNRPCRAYAWEISKGGAAGGPTIKRSKPMIDSSSDDPIELSDSDDTKVMSIFMKSTHPDAPCTYHLDHLKYSGIDKVTVWDWCETGKSVWVREVGHDETKAVWEIPLEDLGSLV